MDAFDSYLVVFAELCSVKIGNAGADELEDAIFLTWLVLLACYNLLQIHRFFFEFETEIPYCYIFTFIQVRVRSVALILVFLKSIELCRCEDFSSVFALDEASFEEDIKELLRWSVSKHDRILLAIEDKKAFMHAIKELDVLLIRKL